MATMNRNDGRGFLDITISVERDDGVFLGLVVHDGESFNELVDGVTSRPDEIEDFFDEVARAKADWDRLRATN